MRTIWALFEDFPDAKVALHDLSHAGLAAGALNVIAQAGRADNYTGDTPRRTVADTAERMGPDAGGLEAMLRDRQPVTVLGAGPVYVTGEMAGLVAKAATAAGATEGGLAAALTSFGVPEAVARSFEGGVAGGGLLVWVRADDDRAAEVTQTLRLHHGRHVGSYQ